MGPYLCLTEADTERSGREIARGLAPMPSCISSATTARGRPSSRAIAAEPGANPLDVASPSFAILHEYPRRNGAPIIHIDGYRLSDNRASGWRSGSRRCSPAPA